MEKNLYSQKKYIYFFIIILLLVISIAIKIFADLIYYDLLSYPSWSIFRHILFFGVFLLLVFQFSVNKYKNKYTFDELKKIILFLSLVLCISLINSVIGNDFTTKTLAQLYFIGSPAIMAILIVDSFSIDEIDTFFKVLFLAVATIYIYYKISDLTNINNYLLIDFWNSYSPFESSAFSGYFYGFMVYFSMTKTNKKNIWSFLGIIFVFLTFKRINVIVSFIFLLSGHLIKSEKKFSKLSKYIMITIFTILPVFTYYIMKPDILFNIARKLGFEDTKGLMMGRDNFFYLLKSYHYKSYGLGSMDVTLNNLTGHGFELDGLRIYMELGIIGCLIMASFFWNITERYFINGIIVFIFFINYLTSAQLVDNYSLLFMFITIFINNKINKERENDFHYNECL